MVVVVIVVILPSPRSRSSGGPAAGSRDRRCRGPRACPTWRRATCRRSPPSDAPPRSSPRRSVSVRANRQERIWPSAVRRVRSQAPQNGRVTDAMTPTTAGPPSTTHRSAGAPPRSVGSGVSVNAARSISMISPAVTISARCQPCWASSGICSMNRSSKPCSMANRSSGTASSSLTPRSSTVLILTGSRPAARAAARPARTSDEPVAAGDRGEPVGPQRVHRDVEPVDARRGQPLGAAGEADAVGGERDVRTRPQGRRRRDDVLQAAAQQRLAAGEAQLLHAEVVHRDRHEPDELVVGELLVARHPVEAFGGHAVGAAQVAAVGQGDARSVATRPNESTRRGSAGRAGSRRAAFAQRGEAQLGCRHTTSVTARTDLQPASDQREYVTPHARCRRPIRAADAGSGPGRG